jgi:hypothetical protein
MMGFNMSLIADLLFSRQISASPQPSSQKKIKIDHVLIEFDETRLLSPAIKLLKRLNNANLRSHHKLVANTKVAQAQAQRPPSVTSRSIHLINSHNE